MIYELIAGAGTDWVGGQEHVSAGFHHMGDDTMTAPRQLLLHMHSIYLIMFILLLLTNIKLVSEMNHESSINS